MEKAHLQKRSEKASEFHIRLKVRQLSPKASQERVEEITSFRSEDSNAKLQGVQKN